MGPVQISISFILVLFTLFILANTGDAAAVRRDVPIIGIPFRVPSKAAVIAKSNSTETSNKTAEKDKPKKDKKDIHESYPNPPVPTPAGFSIHKLLHKGKKEKPADNKVQHDSAKTTPTSKTPTVWGFNDKYLASQNKLAIKRNALFDGVGGDSMSFSNFRVLGNQDVTFGKK